MKNKNIILITIISILFYVSNVFSQNGSVKPSAQAPLKENTAVQKSSQQNTVQNENGKVKPLANTMKARNNALPRKKREPLKNNLRSKEKK